MTDAAREHVFEDEIVKYLVNHAGWQQGDFRQYDRKLALYLPDLFAWVRESQPDAWAELERRHNGQASLRFAQRVADELDQRGTLDVLRRGVVDLGVKVRMCEFQPANELNPDTLARYQQNRLTVVRQLRFSPDSEQSVDLALFVNGVPTATAELKTPLKGQTYEDAIRQYKEDRDPREPLFAFKRRALVHFAVDTDEVYMTTRLAGPNTKFLPFNKGRNYGAGNPDNPNGYRTAYLWEEIWERSSWLQILAEFVHIERETIRRDGKAIRRETLIFPRYHQLEAVRKLLADSKAKGPGQRYLIQHSAGSGKSITIAWLAHQLSKLHDPTGKLPIFDSVIVVTDRLVLDQQLQDKIYQIEHEHGVVYKIDKDSTQLADALRTGSAVIITTLQKFPFALDKMGDLPNRNYAVIIDEAHTSQTGEYARHLREALAPGDQRDDEDEEGFDVEQALNRYMRTRGFLPNLSYYAFTATPSQETIELFGTPTPDGPPKPFHLYTMRQAIEENFILDVLKNYTTYRTYYNLLQRAQEDPNVERSAAARAMAQFASLHPYNLRQKTQVIIEHFRRVTMHKIGGKGKAMVVTSSRKHAVRYKQAFERYIQEKGYEGIGVLVAFSGEVVEDDGSRHTERSMNPQLGGEQIRDAFAGSDYNVLLVAEKFQTGFDQPLLHTMYVDKKLRGIKAVQTLSRLNRTHPGKEDTFILDFVNDVEDIKQAFARYYEATLIESTTDPNRLYDLKHQMDAVGVYNGNEVLATAGAFLRGRQAEIHRHLDPAVHRFQQLAEDDQVHFRDLLRGYLRLYSFLAQIMPFQDAEMEALYLYGRLLITKLARDRRGPQYDFRGEVDLEYYRLIKTFEGDISLSPSTDTSPVKPAAIKVRQGKVDDPMVPLSQVIEDFNQRFGTKFTDEDRIIEMVEQNLLRNPSLQDSARVNSKDNFRIAFTDVFDGELFEVRNRSEEFFRTLLENEEIREALKEALLNRVYPKLRELAS